MITPDKKGATPTKTKKAEPAAADLSKLPKYICYKAALLREKKLLKQLLALTAFCLVCLTVSWQVQVYWLHQDLRKKEYILAPGVQNFTHVSPQRLPEGYLHDAVEDFVSNLSTINAQNARSSYRSLSKFMSKSFAIKFGYETADWIERVIDEDLAQISKIMRKEIVSDEQGYYLATAHLRVDRYMQGQYLGHEEQVVQLRLQLTPPSPQKRWYLQIEDLQWSKLESFRQTRKKGSK